MENEYDANGKLTNQYYYDADGKIKYKHEYDANGNLTGTTYYNPDGTVKE